ncbi:hypothetical protein HPP92_007484 [Vanilla planifolia]|uniref:CBF1-interacting co-repressor CIR N-terminal domain-containing protein n=1 Tax=Vanilla planifolia TaxID=51239 RepID=A0A835RM25_VANPL|nr:hypothetical protein HPP92_007484 [Vanilla planifolia]
MALKFLNKKGWHTGSLRNIENVWKAEQKHDAEQKKLEELRKQINEERERSEFRQLQEAAGLVPRQERLDFLYESGLAVGKGSSDGFKVLQAQPSAGASSSAVDSSSSKAAVPGALFEDKGQSANDAWRKLHSDPLLLIRQKEQEALARIKNNPIRMAMIQKTVESEKKKQEDRKEKSEKRRHKKHSNKVRSDSKNTSEDDESCDVLKSEYPKSSRNGRYSSSETLTTSKCSSASYKDKRKIDESTVKHHNRDADHNLDTRNRESYSGKRQQGMGYNGRRGAPKMTDEEREARLREMQENAELHEEQRCKRLKKAAETDALEAKQASYVMGKSFLDETQKNVYGMDKGGSATIEESVRRRTYYSQGHSAHESNAFRR